MSSVPRRLPWTEEKRHEASDLAYIRDACVACTAAINWWYSHQNDGEFAAQDEDRRRLRRSLLQLMQMTVRLLADEEVPR